MVLKIPNLTYKTIQNQLYDFNENKTQFDFVFECSILHELITKINYLFTLIFSDIYSIFSLDIEIILVDFRLESSTSAKLHPLKFRMHIAAKPYFVGVKFQTPHRGWQRRDFNSRDTFPCGILMCLHAFCWLVDNNNIPKNLGTSSK